MKIGFYLYHMKVDDPSARGFFQTAFHLYNGLKNSEGIELIDMGPRNAHKRHLKKAGLDAVFHFCPPHFYDHCDVAPNFVFTMWESPKLPGDYVERLKKAEYHIVPSTFCKDVWKRAGLESAIVPLGVMPEILQLDPGRRILRGPGTPRIRFLYVVSSKETRERKGASLITPAWKEAFEGNPEAWAHTQLYLKYVNPDPAKREIRFPYKDERLVMDGRLLEVNEMAELYGSADVFIYPSVGEGFGLPPLEAMAAGALAVCTDAGGMSDFINSERALMIERSQRATMKYAEDVEIMVPTVHDVATKLKGAFKWWGTPTLEGIRKRGYETARGYIWQNSVAILAHTIEGVLKQRMVAA
jgi:glycosyltransferase involved in cell wall biosynthesis